MIECRLLINGELVAGDSTLAVVNPSTEEIIADCCPRASERQLNEAVAAAKSAFPEWSAKSFDERKAVINAMADTIEANSKELAVILTQERGQPLSTATRELHRTAVFFRYFASLELPVKILDDSENRRVEIHRKPLGVVGTIIPWNYPMQLMSFKVPAALIAGNTVILKPAPTTPLTTLRFAELVKDILPAGVLNVITDANDLGPLMTAHPDICKISLTGSTATGMKVMAGAAGLLKRITLELGGNDAAIVLGDMDPKEVASQIFPLAFSNSGQICVCIKRLYVHDSIYDAVCDELAILANETIVGDGFHEGTKMGPLQNKMQFERVKELLEESKKDGKIIAGGEIPDRPGYFIRPTIVRDIKEGSRLVDEEQFGPILPVIKFTDVEDAIKRSNSSSFGLGGSIWSSDLELAYSLANKMEAGTVWVNQHANLDPFIPLGGSKLSGLGKELGEEGLEEYTQMKVINIAKPK